MPKQLLPSTQTPTLVLERLLIWGRAIRAMRVKQKLSAAAVCSRVGVSRFTYARVEKGEPTVAVSVYLSVLMVVGLLDLACPALPASLTGDGDGAHPKARVRAQPVDLDAYF